MRSTDEQLRVIIQRAEIIKEKRIMKKAFLADGIASCICLALLIAAAVSLPNLKTAQAGNMASQYGSLLLAAPYIGYVIVSLLAFALGICVTLLCFHWKRWKEREKK